MMRPAATAAGILAAVAIAGCSTAMRQPASQRASSPSTVQAGLTPAEVAKADGGRPAYTAADLHFMKGMIGHHAQAIVMARWAPTHGASTAVRTLAGRIDVAQADEIAMMQSWLRDRREAVPDPSHQMAGHDMPGMTRGDTLMPGMLTAEQMKQLDAARGADFDRLFLTFMIQHHQGALTMVAQLFGSPGAGQEPTIFRFASDVEADQTTEIDRMRTMLGAKPSGP